MPSCYGTPCTAVALFRTVGTLHVPGKVQPFDALAPKACKGLSQLANFESMDGLGLVTTKQETGAMRYSASTYIDIDAVDRFTPTKHQ